MYVFIFCLLLYTYAKSFCCMFMLVLSIFIADEMGMGKTVELLACILAHRKSSSEQGCCSRGITDITEKEKTRINRLKRERVECVCGALSESYKYEGLWVQCDVCDAWQHADCVGYSPSEGIQRTKETSKGKRNSNRRKKNVADIVIMNNEYVCQICLQLMQATSSPIESAATLIICPSSTLPQWHAEILRYYLMYLCLCSLIHFSPLYMHSWN